MSLGGLLGTNEKMYRCEYYPHKGWPMFTCESFADESYEVRRVNIKWVDPSTARVVFDEVVAFECEDGKWRRTRP